MRLKNLTTFVAIAGALSAPVLIAANASADTTKGVSSAFGVSATGLVNIDPTPSVNSVTGPKEKSLVKVPLNPLVSAKAVHVSARGSGSRASVADLSVLKAALKAQLITAKCVDGRGSSHLAQVSLGGRKLAVNPAPNTAVTVQIPGVGGVQATLNKQVQNRNNTLTVTALEVKLGVAGVLNQTIDISSATCTADRVAPPNGGGNGDPSPTPGTGTNGGGAPTPTPVPTDLPVTG